MKRLGLLVFIVTIAITPAKLFAADEIDGSDVRRELNELEGRMNKLSLDEQLKLRAAQQKAAADPEVQAALEKRNEAIREFRATLRTTMIKSDPSLESLLDRIGFLAVRAAATPAKQ
jgi:hypothetical protein